MSSFSDRLRQLRTQQRLSQDDLARILGLARSTVASYENGSRTPDITTLTRIASYFEISVDYLLGRPVETGPPSEYSSVLQELNQMLSSSPLPPDKKQAIMAEIRDYFRWKLDQANRSQAADDGKNQAPDQR